MRLFFKILIFAFLITACKPDEPVAKYQYETKPHYSWGYVDYFGAYYADYKNTNNVLSLSLFSDSLKVNDAGELEGLGQYLYVEDIFVSPPSIFLPEGDYVSSTSEKPFTFYPGVKYPVDDVTVNVGTYMYYIEKNKSFTTMKHVSRGTFNVKIVDNKHVITCNFVLSDSSKVEGTFTGELPHIDRSIEVIAETPRQKLKLPL